MERAKRCAELIKESSSIVVLSGAGISTNAGIPDFRGPNGIYTTKKFDPDRTFGLRFFLEDPLPFYDFARDFVTILEKARPTFTHKFFATLEKEEKVKGIITQNIDGLHQMAGSKNVLELHGSFKKSYCLQCGKEYDFDVMKKKIFNEKVPHCDECGGLIKPDIVFFGEQVKDFERAEELVYNSDLFFVVGSSLAIYPAAMLADFARQHVVVVARGEVNIDPSRVDIIVNDEDIDEFFRKVSKILMEVKDE
jgi:NAD-dependent deacetylase